MTCNRKKERSDKSWCLLLILSLLFYGGLLLLTIYAKDIHNARLPHVTAGSAEKQTFTYRVTLPDGFTAERNNSFISLPKELIDAGQVFLVKTVAENDCTYYCVHKIYVTVDESKENADYYAIADGIESRDIVVLTGYENLQDGDEVYLIRKTKKQAQKLFQ